MAKEGMPERHALKQVENLALYIKISLQNGGGRLWKNYVSQKQKNLEIDWTKPKFEKRAYRTQKSITIKKKRKEKHEQINT